MSRQPTKLRMWIGQPVNAPFATPPLGLRIVSFVCVLSVVFTLGLSVFSELAVGGTPSSTALELATISVIYFVLPILVIVAISANRSISRPLILVYVGTLVFRATSYIFDSWTPSTFGAYAALVVLLFWCAIFWWLYRSNRARTYYSLISNEGIPKDLKNLSEKLSEPSRIEMVISKAGQIIAPYLEIAVVLIVLVAIGYAIGISDSGEW